MQAMATCSPSSLSQCSLPQLPASSSHQQTKHHSPCCHPVPAIRPRSLQCPSSVHRSFSGTYSRRRSSTAAPSTLLPQLFLVGNAQEFQLKVLGSRRNVKSTRISVEARQKGDPLKIMIAGAPASGKGTQCELIVNKYGLTHISAGDLLRAEVAAGTENGKNAKECMTNGQLVPDEIVVTMVKERLAQSDVQKNGWLLDGYPRSLSQAQALETECIRPDCFILLDVPDEVLMERVVGRRLDPITGKIYHLKYSPPENEEISTRLTQRFDDTEAKVKLRLQTHNQNMAAVLSIYKDSIRKVDGNRPKDVVFKEIEKFLADLLAEEPQEVGASIVSATNGSSRTVGPSSGKESWKGIPTRLNTIPHSREIRQYFYKDVCEATRKAVEDGIHKLKIQIVIPELNPEMDVYRIGTLLELMRELAFTFAYDGKRVKVCVQGSMGEGIFSGMPLQLAGTRRLLEFMDWGDYEAKGNFINIGSIGANDVHEEDELFILMAPQNAVGNCIIEDLQAMVNAAGQRPVIIVNPRLKDLPSASGVMQIRGREKRMEFAGSFFACYNFRLLYTSGTQYPILGALRMAYPSEYELYRRVDLESGKEKYILFETFNKEPSRADINDAFAGRLRRNGTAPTGIWGFLSSLF